MFECPSDHKPDVINDKGLAQIIKGTGAQSVYRGLEGTICGHQDDRNVLMANPQLSQETHTVEVRHVNIGHDQVRWPRRDSVQRRLAVVSRIYLIALLRENLPKQCEGFLIVVHNQNPRRSVHLLYLP